MGIGMVFWLVIGAVAIAGVLGNSYAAAKKTALIESFLEKGQPIPPALLASAKIYDWRGFMVAGVVSTASGIALLIFFLALIIYGDRDREQDFLPFISAFPLCIGIAFLLIANYLRKHE